MLLFCTLLLLRWVTRTSPPRSFECSFRSTLPNYRRYQPFPRLPQTPQTRPQPRSYSSSSSYTCSDTHSAHMPLPQPLLAHAASFSIDPREHAGSVHPWRLRIQVVRCDLLAQGQFAIRWDEQRAE